jgi:hypothetical protein
MKAIAATKAAKSISRLQDSRRTGWVMKNSIINPDNVDQFSRICKSEIAPLTPMAADR